MLLQLEFYESHQNEDFLAEKVVKMRTFDLRMQINVINYRKRVSVWR